MVNYQLGKIYKIVCNTTGLVYFGSTTEPNLSRRLAKHTAHFRQYTNGGGHFTTSYEILKNNNFEIILVEQYPCNSKDELYTRERYFIENNECVNKIIPTRSPEEKIEYLKKYNEENKERLTKLKKQYREQNKDKLAEGKKQYYEQNKERILEHYKNYRENARKINCECGSSIVHHNLHHHVKSMKHINFINNTNTNKNVRKINCECGSSIVHYNLHHHVKSMKHINFMNNNNNNI